MPSNLNHGMNTTHTATPQGINNPSSSLPLPSDGTATRPLPVPDDPLAHPPARPRDPQHPQAWVSPLTPYHWSQQLTQMSSQQQQQQYIQAQAQRQMQYANQTNVPARPPPPPHQPSANSYPATSSSRPTISGLPNLPPSSVAQRSTPPSIANPLPGPSRAVVATQQQGQAQGFNQPVAGQPQAQAPQRALQPVRPSSGGAGRPAVAPMAGGGNDIVPGGTPPDFKQRMKTTTMDFLNAKRTQAMASWNLSNEQLHDIQVPYNQELDRVNEQLAARTALCEKRSREMVKIGNEIEKLREEAKGQKESEEKEVGRLKAIIEGMEKQERERAEVGKKEMVVAGKIVDTEGLAQAEAKIKHLQSQLDLVLQPTEIKDISGFSLEKTRSEYAQVLKGWSSAKLVIAAAQAKKAELEEEVKRVGLEKTMLVNQRNNREKERDAAALKLKEVEQELKREKEARMKLELDGDGGEGDSSIVAELKVTIQAKDKVIAEKSKAVEEKEKARQAAYNLLENGKLEKKQVEEAKARLEAEVMGASKQLSSAMEASGKMKSERDAALVRVGELQETLKEKEVALTAAAELVQQGNTARASLKTLREEVKTLRDNLEAKQAEHAQNMSTNAGVTLNLNKEMVEMRKEMTRLEEKIVRVESEKDKAEKELEAARKRVAPGASLQEAALQKEVAALKKDLEHARGEIRGLEVDVKSNNGKIGDLQSSKVALKDECQRLTKALKDAEEDLRKLKASAKRQSSARKENVTPSPVSKPPSTKPSEPVAIPSASSLQPAVNPRAPAAGPAQPVAKAPVAASPQAGPSVQRPASNPAATPRLESGPSKDRSRESTAASRDSPYNGLGKRTRQEELGSPDVSAPPNEGYPPLENTPWWKEFFLTNVRAIWDDEKRCRSCLKSNKPLFVARDAKNMVDHLFTKHHKQVENLVNAKLNGHKKAKMDQASAA